jgi:hypothetical protein
VYLVLFAIASNLLIVNHSSILKLILSIIVISGVAIWVIVRRPPHSFLRGGWARPYLKIFFMRDPKHVYCNFIELIF